MGLDHSFRLGLRFSLPKVDLTSVDPIYLALGRHSSLCLRQQFSYARRHFSGDALIEHTNA